MTPTRTFGRLNRRSQRLPPQRQTASPKTRFEQSGEIDLEGHISWRLVRDWLCYAGGAALVIVGLVVLHSINDRTDLVASMSAGALGEHCGATLIE